MRVVRYTKIKDFPPKLRELALMRATAEGIPRAEALEKIVDAAFTWSNTPEGHTFWSNVADGQEFNWKEESEGRFNRYDIIVHPTAGRGYYVNQRYIEYIEEGRGWSRIAGIPHDYISRGTNKYWAIDEKEWTKESSLAIKPQKPEEIGSRGVWEQIQMTPTYTWPPSKVTWSIPKAYKNKKLVDLPEPQLLKKRR